MQSKEYLRSSKANAKDDTISMSEKEWSVGRLVGR